MRHRCDKEQNYLIESMKRRGLKIHVSVVRFAPGTIRLSQQNRAVLIEQRLILRSFSGAAICTAPAARTLECAVKISCGCDPDPDPDRVPVPDCNPDPGHSFGPVDSTRDSGRYD